MLNPEHAALWTTQQEAEIACQAFDAFEIRVSWAECGNYVCKGFRVEKRSEREFAVFCEGPFTATIEGKTAQLNRR